MGFLVLQPNKNNIFIDVWHPSPLPAAVPGTGWRRWLAGAGSMQPSIVIVMALSWIFQIVCGAVCIITLYRTGPYNSGGGAHALLITPCLVIVMLHIINTLSTAELPRTGDTWQHGTQKTVVKRAVSYEAIRKLYVTFFPASEAQCLWSGDMLEAGMGGCDNVGIIARYRHW